MKLQDDETDEGNQVKADVIGGEKCQKNSNYRSKNIPVEVIYKVKIKECYAIIKSYI